MQVNLAAAADADDIVANLPLPRQMDASPAVYRSYFRIKVDTYINTPGAGIVCGRVEGQLAGFIFFCADSAAVTEFTSSRAMKWRILRALFRGDFGYNPLVLLQMRRWAKQHTASRDSSSADNGAPTDAASASTDGPDEAGIAGGINGGIAAWVGTVHTADDFRRIGVATALLREVERILAAGGNLEVALWVATENTAAVELYEKRGYRRHKIVARIGEECWLMRKDLSMHTIQ